MSELFGEVLRLCHKGGLVKPGVVSIDGTRIAGSANPDVNLAFEQIASFDLQYLGVPPDLRIK